MPIQFSCPLCARRFEVPDEAAGRKATCDACGKTITVPGERVSNFTRAETSDDPPLRNKPVADGGPPPLPSDVRLQPGPPPIESPPIALPPNPRRRGFKLPSLSPVSIVALFAVALLGLYRALLPVNGSIAPNSGYLDPRPAINATIDERVNWFVAKQTSYWQLDGVFTEPSIPGYQAEEVGIQAKLVGENVYCEWVGIAPEVTSVHVVREGVPDGSVENALRSLWNIARDAAGVPQSALDMARAQVAAEAANGGDSCGPIDFPGGDLNARWSTWEDDGGFVAIDVRYDQRPRPPRRVQLAAMEDALATIDAWRNAGPGEYHHSDGTVVHFGSDSGGRYMRWAGRWGPGQGDGGAAMWILVPTIGGSRNAAFSENCDRLVAWSQKPTTRLELVGGTLTTAPRQDGSVYTLRED
ncbi:MAG: hypothetical protein AAF805_00025 [Planctomycetota bacterium]